MLEYIEKTSVTCPECGIPLRVFDGKFIRCNNYKCQYVADAVEDLSYMLEISDERAKQILSDYQAIIDGERNHDLESQEHYESAFVRIHSDMEVLEWVYPKYECREDDFLLDHYQSTGIKEYVLMMILEGQIDKVSVQEWYLAIKHFKACYPFTLEGCEAA